MGMDEVELIVFNALKNVDDDEKMVTVLAALSNVLIGLSLEHGISKEQFQTATSNQLRNLLELLFPGQDLTRPVTV